MSERGKRPAKQHLSLCSSSLLLCAFIATLRRLRVLNARTHALLSCALRVSGRLARFKPKKGIGYYPVAGTLRTLRKEKKARVRACVRTWVVGMAGASLARTRSAHERRSLALSLCLSVCLWLGLISSRRARRRRVRVRMQVGGDGGISHIVRNGWMDRAHGVCMCVWTQRTHFIVNASAYFQGLRLYI